MNEMNIFAVRRWIIRSLVAGLAFACSNRSFAQGPDAVIDSPSVKFFSYGGRLDTSFDGVDQVYSSDAGLTLFLDGNSYGFTGAATEGPTGADGDWVHLNTEQLTPNSYRDDLQIVTGQGDIDIAQLVSYFPGSASVNISVTITNNSSASFDAVRLIYGADTFINGDDRGDFGVEDFIATRSVGTQDNTPETLFSGLSGFPSIDDPGVSSMNYLSGFFRTVWEQVRSGSLPDTIDQIPLSRDQAIAISFDKANPLQAGESWTVRLQWIYEIPQALSLSSCNVTSPASQSSYLGDVAIVFDGNNSNSNPIDSTFEYSTDDGQSWELCTAAAASSLSNPDRGRGTPFVGASFIWDPVADGIAIGEAETVDLRVRVVESAGGQPSQCIVTAVTIERAAPRLVPIGGKEIAELAELSFTATANPGLSPSLAFSLADGSSGLVPVGAAIDPLTGFFSWTPTELQGPGVFAFDVVVTGSSGSDRETITVTVSEVNSPPSLPAITDKTVEEGAELAFAITATDADRPVDTLSYSLDAASLAIGMAIDPDTGQFTWTPGESRGQNEYDVTVTVQDNHGEGGGAMDSESFRVRVAEINDPPVLANLPAQITGEGLALTFTASASDTDLPAQTLTFSLDQGSIDLGMSIDPSTGVFNWIPTERQGPGSYIATVTVDDGGYPAIADPKSDLQEVMISVTEVNRPPVLGSIGNRQGDEEQVIAFSAAASDPDLPANALTFSLADGAGGAVPAGAAITPGGAFSWTPTEAQGPGSYSFDIVVRDDGAPQLVDSETITLTVAETNRPPVLAAIGDRSIAELQTLAFSASAGDPDTPANALTFSLADGAGGAVPAGAAITSGGAFSWTPTEVQGPGSFTFDIVVRDNGDPQLADAETVTVTVTNILDPTTTLISSNINPSVSGQTIIVSASVNPPEGDLRVPSGIVELRDGEIVLDSKTLAGGQTSFTISDFAVAPHRLTAIYRGDTEFLGSASSPLEQVVNRAVSRSGVLSSSNPSAFGEAVTFTASVAAVAPGVGIPSGGVNFLIDGTLVETKSLVDGSASLTRSDLPVGSREVTINYLGSDDFLPSTSVALQQSVGKAASTTVVASNNIPSRLGESVTLMATVSVDPPGRGAPEGTVEFLDGNSSLGVFPLSPAGTAEVSLDSLALGSHPITAKYSGDDSIAENSSAPLDQVVNLPIFTISELASQQPEGTTPGTGPIDFTFTVTKNEVTPGPVSIAYSVVGSGGDPAELMSDFDAPPPAGFPEGTLDFGSAAGSQVLSLRVRPDDLFEPDESFTVSLSNLTVPSQSVTSASGTILNDDELRISIDASQATAIEAQGSAPGVFTVSRNGDDGQVSIDLQLAPSSTAAYPADFTLSNVAGGSGAFTATIPEGSSSIEISLVPVDDLAAEASEFASLQVIAAPEYDIEGSGAANVTIPANDLAATSLDDFDPAISPNGGEGTLRQALLNADSFPGADVVVFGPGVSGTLLLTAGELLVASDLSIIGPGPGLLAISGDLDQSGSPTPGDTRVIRVDDGDRGSVINVTLSGLSITGGMALGDTYPENAGGGILNYGESLTVEETTVSQNAADFGGGIENGGELLVSRSTISFNSATELGGGIDNFGSTLMVEGSTFSDNSAGFGGGGIENTGSASIHGSTFVGNFAVKVAGAVDNFGGDLAIANSTVSGNESQIGGGLVHENGLMTIVNSTVVGNNASLSLNASVGGGVYLTDTPNTTAHLDNSIVAGNTRDFNGASIPSDLGGKLLTIQSSNNLIGDAGSAGGLQNGTSGNLTGIGGTGTRALASIISPLGNNGGATQTHALIQGSPAIDAGNNSLAVSTDATPFVFDQRGSGYPRIVAGTVDIGAYERLPSSGVRIIEFSVDPGSGAQITWISEPGQSYGVLRSLDLISWTVVSPPVAATSEVTQWTDENPPALRAFYVVRPN